MKLSISILIFLFALTGSFAQFTVQSEGNTIASGHVFNFSTTSYPANQLSLIITNTSSETKQYLFKSESITNSNGSSFQICVMTCYYGIAVGNTYPLRTDLTYSLASGASSASNDIHLLNEDTGAGNFPMDFVFKLYESDAVGSELGTPFYLTYRYDPSLSVDNQVFQNLKIYPNISDETVYINSAEKPVKYKLIDLMGRTVLVSNVLENHHTVNITSLQPQTYLLKIEDLEGNFTTQKIIKI